MAHNTDFSRIYATANDGLSIWEVARALGRSVKDLGQLCGDIAYNNGAWERAGAINKWAKYKPLRHDSHGILTEQQRMDKAHGLEPGNFGAPIQVITALIGGSDGWTYNPPRGKKNTSLNPTNADEWFRLLDFNGYHKNAATPYRIGAVSHPSVYEAKIIDVVREVGAEIKVEDFPLSIFGDDATSLSDVYVYLLVKKQAEPTVTICHPTGGDISLADITTTTNTINFTIPATLANTNDTYHMVAVASTWTQDDAPDAATWVVLPGSYQAAVINDQMFFVDMLYRVDKDTSFHYQIGNNDDLTWGMELDLYNDDLGDSASPVTLHFQVARLVGTSFDILDEYTATIQAPIDEGYDEPFTLNHVFDISALGAQTPANIYLRAYYTYEEESDTSHYVYRRYFNIWRDAGSSNAFENLQTSTTQTGPGYAPFTSIENIINPQQ